MNKLFKFLSASLLGVAMSLGIAIGVSSGVKNNEVNGSYSTITKTDTISIENIAEKYHWEKEKTYASWELNDYINISTEGTGNNGKYYSSNESWRLYEVDNGKLLFKGSDGITINTIKFTYRKGHNGTIYSGNVNYSSGEVINVNSKNRTFSGVRKTEGDGNGSVEITEIEVKYSYIIENINATINGALSVNINAEWKPTNITENNTGNVVTGVTYSFLASDGATISSSDSSTGAFTASSVGKVTVSATKIGYDIAPKQVIINPTTPYINLISNVGSSAFTGQRISISADYGNGVTGITWSCLSGTVTNVTTSDSEYSATIGGSDGILIIQAKDNGSDLTKTVSINVSKVTLSLNTNTLSIVPGQRDFLIANHNAKSVGGVIWSSDNPNIKVDRGTVSVEFSAKIGESGTITATSLVDSSVSATCLVSVIEGSSKIIFSASDISGFNASYAERDWSSDLIKGKIHAYKAQYDVIQLKANTSYLYNTVAIPGPITNITLLLGYNFQYSELTCYFGKEAITSRPKEGGIRNDSDWSWNVNPDENEYNYFYIFASSDKAKGIGSVIITYKKVEFVDPTAISINNDDPVTMDTYGYGNRKLNATVLPANARDKTVIWGSFDSSVATVSDGVITPTGVGSTTIYAHTTNYDPENPNLNLIKTVDVTVNQALYKKATYVITSEDTLLPQDDYLSTDATISTDGAYNNDHLGIQLSKDRYINITIPGYQGMKITGVDLVMSSNADSGGGSLSIDIGSMNVLNIESSHFNSESWNGKYDTNPTNLYKDTAAYVVDENENITFSFLGTTNSLYVSSVSIRYLDYKLESWCNKFMNEITCDGINSIIDDSKWGDLGDEFLALPDELKTIAANATADKKSESTIEQAMARYDLIIIKYTNTHDDFIGRFGPGTINGPLNPVSSIFNNGNGNNTTLIVIIISVISINGLGALIFIRKRKVKSH